MNSYLLLWLCLLPISIAQCPTGTVQGPSADGCLLFATQPLPWQQAEDECAKRGGHLASVDSSDFNSFLKASVPTTCSHVSWIGGRIIQRKASGAWTWSDDAPYSFTNWALGQPTSKATMCLVYDVRTGSWYSEMCASAKPYICKLPVGAGNEPSSNDPACSAQTAVPNCEDEWTYNAETGKCYKVMEQNATWPIHETKCNLLGAHLTSILSASENTFVKGLKDMVSCPFARYLYRPRIAGKGHAAVQGQLLSCCSLDAYQDASSPLDFKWVDQSTFLYRNWAPKRPVFGSFPTRTFASLYADPMIEVSKQQGTKGFNGKWDHYPPEGITHVRAGVCKRDY